VASYLQFPDVSKEILREIFTTDTPLLDVRAPVEFAKGSFPTAVNYPILNDDEREKVGICYKKKGPDTARALGYELVSGSIRQNRINQWTDFSRSNPSGYLYCFRGGLRSQIAAEWLSESGSPTKVVPGGYKAMRNFLLDVFNSLPEIVILSGRTGIGKTELLQEYAHSLDLEGRANHRGSAFGRQITDQPTQINFENAVAIDLLNSARSVIVEDEGRMIGKLQVPLPLQKAMKNAPVILLEDTVANRVDRIHQEYIVKQVTELTSAGIEDPVDHLETQYSSALSAIRKRLGGANYSKIAKTMETAFSNHKSNEDSHHKVWISDLLHHYYDPMYDYQLEQKRDRIAIQGNRSVIRDYLNTRFSPDLAD